MFKFDSEKQYGICSTPFNKTIIFGLQKQGINLKVFPSAEIVKNTLDEKSKELLSNLEKFDWIIFPDIFAVDLFVEILQEEEIDLFDLDLIRICALGEAVADRLRFSQIHADLIPTKIDSRSVIKSFEAYLSDEFKDVKILMIQNSELSKELAEKEIENHKIEIYKTILPDSTETAKLKALLNGGAVDVFLFYGIEEIAGLKLLFPDDSLENLLSESEIIALEPIVYQHLRERNLRPKLFKM